MAKPLAVALIQGHLSQPERVPVNKSRARAAGADGVSFYAPTWRPMVFRSLEGALAKLERHPGFMGWQA